MPEPVSKFELRLAVAEVMHLDIMFMPDGYVIVVDHEPTKHVHSVAELKLEMAKVLNVAFSLRQESEVKKSPEAPMKNPLQL